MMSTVRELRAERGMKQSDLARLAGITQATVSLIERGEVGPNGPTRRALAQAFGVAEDEITFTPRRQKGDVK